MMDGANFAFPNAGTLTINSAISLTGIAVPLPGGKPPVRRKDR